MQTHVQHRAEDARAGAAVQRRRGAQSAGRRSTWMRPPASSTTTCESASASAKEVKRPGQRLAAGVIPTVAARAHRRREAVFRKHAPEEFMTRLWGKGFQGQRHSANLKLPEPEPLRVALSRRVSMRDGASPPATPDRSATLPMRPESADPAAP